ncbi:MAG: hypothetical protein KDD38_09575 [Bdellovibrionales bacterium]|nr:hypothetical protein [Bdellovibrionales bacterium]
MGAKKMQDNKQYEQHVLEHLRPGLNWDKIMVCDNVTPGNVIALALDAGYTHICQSSHPYFVPDLNTSALMLLEDKQFINYPLSSIITPSEVGPEAEANLTHFEYKFEQAGQKFTILQGVGKALGEKKVSPSIQADVLVIADELSTNAVFNAPFVDMENTASGASREDQSTRMHQGKSASIFLGANDTRLVIGCKDPYGTLNLMKLFVRIKKCYDTSVAENINMTGRGGAGIGSFMVFNSSASYYAVVEEGQCTMILCALPVRMSSKTRLEIPKNLHFIIKNKR